MYGESSNLNVVFAKFTRNIIRKYDEEYYRELCSALTEYICLKFNYSK